MSPNNWPTDDTDVPDAVRDDEITPSTHLPHAPDARANAGPTHHQGVDYGAADTTVTVVDGLLCTYGGESYGGGESLRVPRAVAEYLVRSGWATAELDPVPEAAESGDESTAEPDEPAKAAGPPAGRQVKAGAGRRTARK